MAKDSKRIPTKDVAAALALLRAKATDSTLQGMARYAIPSEKAFGVAMRDIQAVGKQIGRNHDLALALWTTGWYEAKTLAAYIDDPALVSVDQMRQWSASFDNWAICDTVCFVLFDRTAFAWDMVQEWAVRDEEYVKRAAFALLWGLTVHDKKAPDASFVRGLDLIESAAADPRHFVKKAVNMALRATGKRNARLHRAATEVAKRLAASEEAPAKWVGKDALRELTSAKVSGRFAASA